MAEDPTVQNATRVGLRTDFSGYYRLARDVEKFAYLEGVLVFDTNALLDLYRLSPPARGDYIKLLDLVKDRIFIPHQVAFEFHERRASAVAARRAEFENALKELEEKRRQTTVIIRNLVVRAYGDLDRANPVIDRMDQAYGHAKDLVDSASDEYDLNPDEVAVDPDDAVLALLEPILDGRVNPRPSDAMRVLDVKEADRRLKEKIPPGFSDAGKASRGGNPHGDYLWWAETKRYVESINRPLVVVTNDVGKGDWVHEVRGMRVGASPYLVEEIRELTGQPLLLKTSGEFLSEAAGHLNLDVPNHTLVETRAIPGGEVLPNHVPRHAAAVITRSKPSKLREWEDAGYLSSSQEIWSWPSVRVAGLLSELERQGAGPDVMLLAAPALADRTKGRNILVIRGHSYEWVKRSEIAEAESDPDVDFLVHWRDLETRMHRIRATLRHPDDEIDGDERDADESSRVDGLDASGDIPDLLRLIRESLLRADFDARGRRHQGD